MQKFKWLLLLIILAVSFILRSFGLLQTPPSLNWDEVSHAYNAYTLLLTGKDQWGQILPLFNFRAYGDYPTTLNLYMTVPFIALGGANDLIVRLPHVLGGVLTVLVLFIAGCFWFRSFKVGLWVGLIACVAPWLLWMNRQVIQSDWVVLLASLGLACYARSKITLAMWLWGVGLLAYHNMRIFLPLLLVMIIVFKKTFRLPLILLFISLVILLLPDSRARNEWVNIINPGSIATIENLRISSRLPLLLSKLIYNKPVYFIAVFLKHFGDYLDPRFVFLAGGTQHQFSLPGWGLLPWMTLPFFYWGLVKLVPHQRFLLLWLVLAIVPAAITIDRWAVIRATLMLPAVFLITGYGLAKLQNSGLILLTLGSLGVYTGFYLKTMFYVYPQNYSQSWQYGYSQVVQIIKEHYPYVDQIIFTKRYGEPHEFVLWYWPWNPNEYYPDWDYHAKWYWVDAFAKFRFVNDWEMQKTVEVLPKNIKYLLVESPENETLGQEISRVNFLDNRPAFIVKTL